MTKELRGRLGFLVGLVLNYNESHSDTRAVFRLDHDSVVILINDEERRDVFFEMVHFPDLTEERTYELYAKLKEASTSNS